MVHLIIWIALGLLALSFFGVSLQALVENPTNQNNLSYLAELIRDGWEIISTWFEATFGSIFHWFQ